ncbi:MAG: hypothetical protein U5L01_05420 [Rheinheimera sp.]|nr:hypothetical protein [Rheinheimera sp.]
MRLSTTVLTCLLAVSVHSKAAESAFLASETAKLKIDTVASGLSHRGG